MGRRLRAREVRSHRPPRQRGRRLGVGSGHVRATRVQRPEQFLTHVVAPLRLTAAAYRRAWSDQREANVARHRSVVNVSSISGQNVYPNEGQSVYAASKAALDHLSAHMALELGPVGIRVNAVAANSFPSVVSTDRVVDAIVALDQGSSTGGLLLVDAAEDAVVSLRGNPDIVSP